MANRFPPFGTVPTRPRCHYCGGVIVVDLHADDDLWEAVMREKFGTGYACVNCFASRADEKLIDWAPHVRLIPLSLAGQAAVQSGGVPLVGPSASDWEAVGGFRFDQHAGWQQVAVEYANAPNVTTLYRKRVDGVTPCVAPSLFEAFKDLAGRCGWDTEQEHAGGLFRDKALQALWHGIARNPGVKGREEALRLAGAAGLLPDPDVVASGVRVPHTNQPHEGE